MKLPPLWRQAVSFLASLARWFRHGRRVVSRAERDRRLVVCNACEHLFHNKGERCGLCGCYLKLKTWMASEHCKDGRW